MIEKQLSDAEIIAASIKQTSEDTATKLVDSNNEVAEKLLKSDDVTAGRLVVRNIQVDVTSDSRFAQQKRWYYSLITISLLTLLILLLFTMAFFKYAIIVKI